MFVNLKGEPNWRSISGLISRNEVGNRHSSFALSFLSCLLITWHLKVMETWQLVLPFCAQQSASVTLQIRLACATRVSICHEPGFLCSSFVKSKQGRLLPELRLKAEILLCNILMHVDRTTEWRMETEIFAHFLCFQASLLWFPFKGSRFLRRICI